MSGKISRTVQRLERTKRNPEKWEVSVRFMSGSESESTVLLFLLQFCFPSWLLFSSSRLISDSVAGD